MRRLVFDIETDGFLKEATTVHSIVLIDVDTGEMMSGGSNLDFALANSTISQCLNALEEASEIIGHNIIFFDLPVLRKLHGFKTDAKVIDTLLLSRLKYPEVINIDLKQKKIPKKLYGNHSLRAWGYRLGNLKGDFEFTEDNYKSWSLSKQKYCEQDVKVTLNLWNKLEKFYEAYPRCVELEHEFALNIEKQIDFGFPFDTKKAEELLSELTQKQRDLLVDLQQVFPPIEEEFIPKVTRKDLGYEKGKPVIKTYPFNPASRKQIGERLVENGWEPTEFTPTGQPKVNESVLSGITVRGAAEISEYLTLDKRIGQLANGSNSWLRLVNQEDGKIHGGVITCGTVTGRCSHTRPNMAQVPNLGSLYGKECRELFKPPEGWIQIGVDASGLELRCLAHYLYPFDGGEYAKQILEGDIHTHNQKAAGLETRDQAKTFIYATLYGAGNMKIGSIVAPQLGANKQIEIGKRLRKRFDKNLPALRQLQDCLEAQVLKRIKTEKRKYLKGIDGRPLPIRSSHVMLNILLQSAGAIVMKEATNIFFKSLQGCDYKYGVDWGQMAHIHDEFQVACKPEHETVIKLLGVKAIREAGETLGFNIPLDGEAKAGKNWSETH